MMPADPLPARAGGATGSIYTWSGTLGGSGQQQLSNARFRPLAELLADIAAASSSDSDFSSSDSEAELTEPSSSIAEDELLLEANDVPSAPTDQLCYVQYRVAEPTAVPAAVPAPGVSRLHVLPQGADVRAARANAAGSHGLAMTLGVLSAVQGWMKLPSARPQLQLQLPSAGPYSSSMTSSAAASCQQVMNNAVNALLRVASQAATASQPTANISSTCSDTIPKVCVQYSTGQQVAEHGLYGNLAEQGHTATPHVCADAAAVLSVAGDQAAGSAAACQLPIRGTYIITGGSGAVADQVALWLASQGVLHVHVCSRSGTLPPSLQLQSQQSSSISPTAAAPYHTPTLFTASKCDVSSSGDVQWLVLQHASNASAAAGLPLLGIMHASGVLADGLMQRMSSSQVKTVWAAKAATVSQLLVAAGLQAPAALVLFSSVASLLGSPGQANYSAANAALDAAAAAASQQGLPTISIQWGAWAGGGMAATHAARMQRMGLSMLQPVHAMQMLSAAIGSLQLPAPSSMPSSSGNLPLLQHHTSVLAAACVSWPALSSAMSATGSGVDSLLEDVVSPAVQAVRVPHIAQRLSKPGRALQAAAAVASQKTDVQKGVSAAVRNILGSDVSADTPLMSAGLDSLGAVELRNSLEAQFRLSLPQTLMFDYPTVEAISSYIAAAAPNAPAGSKSLSYDTRTQRVQRTLPTPARAATAAISVALEPMVTRLPPLLNASSPEHALHAPGSACGTAGHAGLQDRVCTVPLQRWDMESEPRTCMAARFGAYLPHIDSFDMQAFGMAEAEAVLMDPQQRLLLEASATALMQSNLIASSTATIASTSLHHMSSSTNHPLPHALGAYVGVASSDYGALVKSHTSAGALHATSNALSVVAGRLAFVFGLTGPALSVDTACSASLVALHLAADAVQAGRLGAALVAGVHVQASPTSSQYVWAAGMLSPQGRCQVMDASADGYVRGETACAMVLRAHAVSTMPSARTGSKATKRATQLGGSGQAAMLLLAGSAVNQDGRSSALTAPNGPAQKAVIEAALADAGLAPNSITQLSMHGTGTPLGDPIEVNAAGTALLRSGTTARSTAVAPHMRITPLSLLASKSHFGHAEPAAGLVALHHLISGQSSQPALMHLRAVNPQVGSVLDQFSAETAANTRVFMPRQSAPHASVWGSTSGGGASSSNVPAGAVSSFAFMGTNAHAILQHTKKAISPTPGPDTPTWQHQHCWVALPHWLLAQQALAQVPTLHSPGSSMIMQAADLSSPHLAFLWDHIVAGKHIMPGAAYMEVAAAASSMLLTQTTGNLSAGMQPCLSSATIPSPLVLPAPHQPSPLPILTCTIDLLTGSLKVISHIPGEHRTNTHLTASVRAAQQSEVTAYPLKLSPSPKQRFLLAILHQQPKHVWGQAAAQSPAACGFLHPEYMSSTISAGPDAGFLLGPHLLDCGLQLGQVFIQQHQASSQTYVPFGFHALLLPGHTAEDSLSPDSQLAVTASPWPASKVQPGTACSNYQLHKCNKAGAAVPVCSINGMQARSFTHAEPAVASSAVVGSPVSPDLLYAQQWQVSQPDGGVATADGGGLTHLQLNESTSIAAVAASAAAALQQLDGPDSKAPSTLHVQLQGPSVSAVCLSSVDLSGPAVHGFMRTAQQEMADKHLAVQITPQAGLPAALHLGGSSGNNWDVYGCMSQHGVLGTEAVPRLLSCPPDQQATGAYQLVPSPRGALSSLKPQHLALPANDAEPLPAGKAVVAVCAVGLNFRDVLNVLGMYPGDPGNPGSDFSGVLMSSNPADVVSAGLQPGTAVFGLAPGCLGSHVQCHSITLAAVPPQLSYEQAATMPTVFITVQLAFDTATAVQPGEAVFVPAAAGGVGLAAVQVLQALGAIPITTAGSPAKRALLRQLGVRCVSGSRSTAYVEEVAAMPAAGTGSSGLSMVLNNLTSPGMVSSALSLLQPGGRFVEIGKRDVFSAARIAQERPDVQYGFLAVDFLPGPCVQRAMQQVAAGAASGVLRPLPLAAHSMTHVAAALRQLSQARHVGKVVVSNAMPNSAMTASGGSTTTTPQLSSLSHVAITGGLGALGLLVAGWLAQQGVPHITLIARTAHTTAPALTALLRAGCSNSLFHIAACDAGAREDVMGCLSMPASTNSTLPVSCLLHAGGVLADATLHNQSLSGMRHVMGAKVSGLSRMLGALQLQPGAQHVLFSSVASLLGSPGQANYSAANAALDAAAQMASTRGLPVLSIQYGSWSYGGMAAQTAAKNAAAGVGALQPQQGLSVLEAVLSRYTGFKSISCVAASPFNWQVFGSKLQQAGRPAPVLLSELVEPPKLHHKQRQGRKPTSRAPQRAYQDPPALVETTRNQVSAAVRAVLGSDVAANAPLMSAGLDSLGAVELRNSLEAQLGITLPGTLVFDYPTVEAISMFIVESSPAAAQVMSADALQESEEDEDADVALNMQMTAHKRVSRSLGSAMEAAPCSVAVVAVSHRSPGAAFTCMMGAALKDHITSIPAQRWDAEYQLTSDAPARFGSWLLGAASGPPPGTGDALSFDASAFSLSGQEAAMMDPQHRLLLEMSAEALHQPSCAANAAARQGCAVYVGISTPDYADLKKTHMPINVYSATGSALSVAAGRVSFTFGLQGPCASIDTACSSSLVALHCSLAAMRQRDATMALASGVKLILTPSLSAMFMRAGMLAADGRCKTLDAAADGYVRGEAAATLAVMPLHASSGRRSPAAHHKQGAAGEAAAWAIIAGCAVNQDGVSSTLTAPNGRAQQAVIHAALEHAGMQPGMVSTLQMHGTGTPLGDPIEVGAAATALQLHQPQRLAFLRLASDKSSIGHTEPAAGVMGVMHVLMTQRQLLCQPILHLRQPNPHLAQTLDAAAGQLLLPRQLQPDAGATQSEGTGSCIAGVSSFAFQGTNAHVLIHPPISTAQSHVEHTQHVQLTWCRQLHSVVVPQHSLLQQVSQVAGSKLYYAVQLHHPAVAWLSEHQVAGKPLLPAAAFLEVAMASVILSQVNSSQQVVGTAACGLAEVHLQAPLVIPAPNAHAAELQLLCMLDQAAATFSITSSRTSQQAVHPTTHVHGKLISVLGANISISGLPTEQQKGRAAEGSCRSMEAVRAGCSSPMDTVHLYQQLHTAGLQYGPTFRQLRTPHTNEASNMAASSLLPSPHTCTAPDMLSFIVHPALLDCAFQLGALVQPAREMPTAGDASGRVAGSSTYVPAAVGLILADASQVGSMGGEPALLSDPSLHAVVTASSARPSGNGPAKVRDLWLGYASGTSVSTQQQGPLLMVQGLESRPLSLTAASSPPASIGTDVKGGKKADDDLMYEVVWVVGQPADAESDAATLQAGRSLTLCSPAASAAAAGNMVMSPAHLTASTVGAMLQTVQPMLAAASSSKPAQLQLASLNSAKSTSGLAAAAAQGLLRTVTQESGGALQATRQQHYYSHNEGAQLQLQLLQVSQQAGDDGYGSRQQHATGWAPRLLPSSGVAPAPAPHQLVPKPRGSLTSLVPSRVDPTQALQPAEACLAVRAVGLNFRDVLNVLGMYPGDPGNPGGDCAGVVVVAGAGASLRPGTPVFGLAGGCLGSHVVCSNKTVVPMPSNLSYEAAATCPTVFITVDAVLHKAANLQRGEAVFLPAAAGGVGLAAIQAVHAAGATVVATAGSPAKRMLLRSLGVQSVSGSRDTLFVSELLPCLSQQGVQVVLNTLTSPGMVSSALSLLQPGGRFVEIGKRDVFSAARIAQERPDVHYGFAAVDFMPEPVLHAAMTTLSSQLAAGLLAPLPAATHSLTHVAAALRQLSQARHVGKVVVSCYSLHTSPISPPAPSTHGSVLVIGGTCSLGVLVLRWLAQQGVRHLSVLSRTGQLPDLLQQLLQDDSSILHQVSVRTLSGDAGACMDAAAACTGQADGPPVTAVLHAGGVLSDATLSAQSLPGLRRVLAPKASATSQLLTRQQLQPGAATVLFSSVASLLGSPGQANYSAANAALDAAAAAASQQGLPTISIQWGAWAGGGMAAGDASTAARVERTGMALITAQAGLSALASALNAGHSAIDAWTAHTLAAVPFHWPAFMRRLGQQRPALFSDFAEEAAAASLAAGGTAAAAGRSSSASRTPAQVRSIIQEAVSSVLGRTDLGAEEPLMSAGLDSLGAVELRNSLEGQLGISLPQTLVFDYPTVDAITTYVVGLQPEGATIDGSEVSHTAAGADSSLSLPAQMPVSGLQPRPVAGAVTGICVRNAGAGLMCAAHPEDAISKVPLSHWDVDALTVRAQHAAMPRPSRFGGWLPDAELFDAAAFGLSAPEALLMDAQQRMLLEATQEAWHMAGSSVDASCSVSVGIASNEYNNWLLRRHPQGISAYGATGGALSVACGRISFLYGLRGPSVSVDTACSSSLVAAHLGLVSLQHHTSGGPGSSTAIAGGVGLIYNPEPTAMFQQAGMLAADGRCKTFDAAADGYIRAEACGVLVMSSQPSSSCVLAVLVGSAVNQDGKSSSLTAPSGPAQQAVIKAAFAAAGLSIDQLAAVEAHGTGTPLGDPIELGAVAACKSSAVSAHGSVFPTSLHAGKSKVGHTEAGAGISSIAHCVSSIGTCALHAILHLNATNPFLHAALEAPGMLCMLPRQPAPHPNSSSSATGTLAPCNAVGVNSFAFQGTNAHVLLQPPSAAMTLAGVRASDGSIWHTPGPPGTPSTSKTLSGASSALIWQRTRFWPAAPASPLVSCLVSVPAPPYPQLVFESNLSTQPGLAFLHDHVVAGQVWLPTSALLHCALQCVATAHLVSDPAAYHTGLSEAVFLAPFVLPLPPEEIGHTPMLRCVLHNSGFLELVSCEDMPLDEESDDPLTPAGTSVRHMRASVCCWSRLPVKMKDSSTDLYLLGTSGASTGVAARTAQLLKQWGLSQQDTPLTNTIFATSSGGSCKEVAWVDSEAGMQAGALAGSMQAADTQTSGLLVISQVALFMHVNKFATHALNSPGASADIVASRCSTQHAADVQLSGKGSSSRCSGILYRAAPATTFLRSAVSMAASTASASRLLRDSSHGPMPAAPTMTLQAVRDLVKSTVEGVLGASVAADQPLMAAGLDSLGATEVRNSLAVAARMELPPTLVFDYPSVEAISTFLHSTLEQQQSGEGMGHGGRLRRGSNTLLRRGSRTLSRIAAAPVAMISGAAQHEPAPLGLLHWWRGDRVSCVPWTRWDCDRPLAAAAGLQGMEARWGAFLSNDDQFDASLFGISPNEAALMDPQQRLLLQVVLQAVPAGYVAVTDDSSPGTNVPCLTHVIGSNTGVFVGVGTNDYNLLCHSHNVPVGPFSFTAASVSVMSGRVAYTFGLQGPSASIDTACSASLVGTHMALQSLREGHSSAAVSAGVMMQHMPQALAMVQRAGMMAADGRCKVADAAADGYVRSEAVRALWLQAVPDPSQTKGQRGSAGPQHSTACAYVCGTAVNSNGKSSGLAAPHGPSQQVLLQAALQEAGIQPASVAGLQMHANGTALGDPIEVGAAAAVYFNAQQHRQQAAPFMWVSMKGHTGHQEAASGSTLLMATQHLLEQQYLPPALHLIDLNPHLEGPLAAGTSYVARGGPTGFANMRTDSSPVFMAVSSFGAQGTNAHAIMGLMQQPHVLTRASVVSLPSGLPAVSEDSPTDTVEQQSDGSASAGRIPARVPARLLLQAVRHWVHSKPQQLIRNALFLKSRTLGVRLVMEGRLDGPHMSWLWDGPTCSSAEGDSSPLLSGSITLAAAASALSLLHSPRPTPAGVSSSTDDVANLQQMMDAAVLHDVVLSKPVALPAKPGRPGQEVPVLQVLVNQQQASLQVRLGMQQQLTAHLSTATCHGSHSAADAAADSEPSEGLSAVRVVLRRIVVQQLTTRVAALGLPSIETTWPQLGLPTSSAYMAQVVMHDPSLVQQQGVHTDGFTAAQPQLLDSFLQLSALQGLSEAPQPHMATAAQIFLAHVKCVNISLAALPSPTPDTIAAQVNGANSTLETVSISLLVPAVQHSTPYSAPVENQGAGPQHTGQQNVQLSSGACSTAGAPSSAQVLHLKHMLVAPMGALATELARAMQSSSQAAGHEAAAAEEEGEAGAVPADHPLLAMPAEERVTFLQAQVMTEVRALIGRAVHPEEPLITAGLDSRSGMELRQALSTSVGIPLPPTLLYDYQTVADIVTFVNDHLSKHEPGAEARQGGEGLGGAGEDEEDEEWPGAQLVQGDRSRATGSAGRASDGGAGSSSQEAGPSNLLKMLRPSPTPRPLFLAAPGVANAQSAYFSFSTYLQWSDQPIYVLDKDNDLNIAQLAERNARDMLAVQPPGNGPYLIGGHSYGGCVAMEISLLLQSWGHDVGLLLIMDTPRPEQVRALQPGAEQATDDEVLEMMEMILGALGRDAVGLGSSITHPRNSEEWQAMSMAEKYAFFAPIWRVMRDDNMSVEDVAKQLQYVALAVKTGSQVSDLRHHRFEGRLHSTQVVYFRATNSGACDYVNDSRYYQYSHGSCWSEMCDTLEVVDVPGDHFSLLRQNQEDMSIIVTILKLKLGAFGWSEAIRRDKAGEFKVPAAEVEELDKYLASMGVTDAEARSRLTHALPFSTDTPAAIPTSGTLQPGTQQRVGEVNPAALVLPGNTAASTLLQQPLANRSPADLEPDLAPMFLVLDSTRSTREVSAWVMQLPRPVFYLVLPPQWHMAKLLSLPALARLFHVALRSTVRTGPYVLGGVGLGGIVAHELAVQVCGSGHSVQSLLLLESAALREAWDASSQPWVQCYHWVAAWRPDLDMAGEYAGVGRTLAARGGYQSQLDYISSLCPIGHTRSDWEAVMEQRTRAAAARCAGTPTQEGATGGLSQGSQAWQEMVYTWACLHDMLLSAADQAAAASPGSGSEAVQQQQQQQQQQGVTSPVMPSLEALVVALHLHEQDPASQLEYISSLKPADLPGRPIEWEEHLAATVWAASYMHALCSEYVPRSVYSGPTVLLHASHSRRSTRDVIAGWSAGYLQRLALLLQPIQLVKWQAELAAASAASSSTAADARDSGKQCAGQLQALLQSNIQGTQDLQEVHAVIAAKAATAAGVIGAAASPPSAMLQQRASVLLMARGPTGGSNTSHSFVVLHSGHTAGSWSPTSTTGEASGPDALSEWFASACTIGPLNQLAANCMQLPGQAPVLQQAQQLTASQPAWLVHNEAGHASASLMRALAGLISAPVWALNMGPGAQAATSLECLAEAYASAVISAQPFGPYVLCGTSPISCMLAFAVGCVLERGGAAVMLLLVDGSPCAPLLPPTQHDPMYYALYAAVGHQQWLAANAGMPAPQHSVQGMPLDAFVALLHAQGGDQLHAQLRVLRTFMPATAAEPGAASSSSHRPAGQLLMDTAVWDAQMLAVVNNAGVLRRFASTCSPSTSFRGPVAMAHTEDATGEAFLMDTRAHCCGALSLLPVDARHGEALATPTHRQAVAACVMEGLLEMMQML